MTVIPFPSTPNTQEVCKTIYQLSGDHPGWEFECYCGEDDRRPYVCVEHHLTGRAFSAHWNHGQWGVLLEDGKVVARSPNLSLALGQVVG